jgi:transcriptional regulator with XRE-family HTH domain
MEPTPSADQLVGAAVLHERKTVGMTQVVLAALCGWSQRKQSAIELGDRRLAADDAIKLARALKTDPSTFYATLDADLPVAS